MRRATVFLGLTLLAAGCSKSDSQKAEGPAGRPGAEEARTCIVAYLGQCGWKDVELVRLADNADLPAAANPPGEAWAFTFSAKYTNVFGERQTSENWVAVLTRADGQPRMKNCFDESKRLVGGHSGEEVAEKGTLTPLPPADDMPAIIAPRP